MNYDERKEKKKEKGDGYRSNGLESNKKCEYEKTQQGIRVQREDK